MSDDRSGRFVLVAAGLVVLALLALVLVVVLAGDGTPEPAAPPAPTARAEPIREAPRAVRVPLPAPAARAHPDPREALPPVRMDPDTKLALNRASDAILGQARQQCLDRWVEGLPEPHRAELVFDFVLHDGDLADLGLRSLHEPVPADIVSCVADVMWSAEWPAFSGMSGELRLQRSVTLPMGAP